MAGGCGVHHAVNRFESGAIEFQPNLLGEIDNVPLLYDGGYRRLGGSSYRE